MTTFDTKYSSISEIYYKSPYLYQRKWLLMGLKCQPFLDGMDFALKPGIDEQCILLFDEMAIKKDLQLRTTDDSVYGYVDFVEFGKQNMMLKRQILTH